MKTAGPSELVYAAIEKEVSNNAQIQIRGDNSTLGDEVPRKHLEILGNDPLPAHSGSGRLQLADWLTREENPLLARVMVNRFRRSRPGALRSIRPTTATIRRIGGALFTFGRARQNGSSVFTAQHIRIATKYDLSTTYARPALAESSGSRNREIIVDFYFAALCREPSDAEIDVALAHIRSTGDRRRGLEDVAWALMNSKEFIFQH